MKHSASGWNRFCHTAQKTTHAQTLRGLPNCSIMFLLRVVLQTTSCCQKWAPAGEQKYSANMLWIKKDLLEELWLQKRGTIQAQLMDQPSQLCSPSPPCANHWDAWFVLNHSKQFQATVLWVTVLLWKKHLFRLIPLVRRAALGACEKHCSLFCDTFSAK